MCSNVKSKQLKMKPFRDVVVSPSVFWVSLKKPRDCFAADTMNSTSITTFHDGIFLFFKSSLVVQLLVLSSDQFSAYKQKRALIKKKKKEKIGLPKNKISLFKNKMAIKTRSLP